MAGFFSVYSRMPGSGHSMSRFLYIYIHAWHASEIRQESHAKCISRISDWAASLLPLCNTRRLLRRQICDLNWFDAFRSCMKQVHIENMWSDHNTRAWGFQQEDLRYSFYLSLNSKGQNAGNSKIIGFHQPQDLTYLFAASKNTARYVPYWWLTKEPPWPNKAGLHLTTPPKKKRSC